MRGLVAVALLGSLAAIATADVKCKMTPQYPPDGARALKWHTIDLDKDPKDRWTDVVTPLSQEIHDMVYQVIDLLPKAVREPLLLYCRAHADNVLDNFPAPFGDEIRGIAKATGIDECSLVLYNIAYEIEGACTSIVAKNQMDNVFHARNLDFGLFFGWDKQNVTWTLTEKLRPLLFNARIVKNGETFYNATYFAGYVGLLTGMKTGGFSITVDTRFDNNFWSGLLDWFKGDHSGHFVGFLTRQTMENNATFEEALATLNNTKMVGPSYMILGGSKPNEGAVITRDGTESFHLWTFENDLHNTSYYLVQTNYDNWKNPPFFDDRRRPAEKCLQEMGRPGVSFEGLFNLLSAQPNLNLLTTYTTLMDVEHGRFEAYLQQCEWPCTPW